MIDVKHKVTKYLASTRVPERTIFENRQALFGHLIIDSDALMQIFDREIADLSEEIDNLIQDDFEALSAESIAVSPNSKQKQRKTLSSIKQSPLFICLEQMTAVDGHEGSPDLSRLRKKSNAQMMKLPVPDSVIIAEDFS